MVVCDMRLTPQWAPFCCGPMTAQHGHFVFSVLELRRLMLIPVAQRGRNDQQPLERSSLADGNY